MKIEQQQLLQKATESLKAAQILINNNLPAFATARAYYTMFYIAQDIIDKAEIMLKFAVNNLNLM